MVNNNNELHIVIAGVPQNDTPVFDLVLQEMKARTSLKVINGTADVMDYLSTAGEELPDMLLLAATSEAMDCISEIRSDSRFRNTTIAIYSGSFEEEAIEEAFIKGANICFVKPHDTVMMKDVMTQVITTYQQYQTYGLPKENFLLTIR